MQGFTLSVPLYVTVLFCGCSTIHACASQNSVGSGWKTLIVGMPFSPSREKAPKSAGLLWERTVYVICSITSIDIDPRRRNSAFGAVLAKIICFSPKHAFH